MGITLRPYQNEALDTLQHWLVNNEGNPCLVVPTGGGKSILIAEYCKRILSYHPQTRFLILTHQKELIEQDVAKLLAVWNDAPIGIYSASIGKKELGKQITAASIQSIVRAKIRKPYNCIIVDEAHLINNKDQGSYRKFIARMKEANPRMRVIGLTATPYRLGQGLVTDGGIFKEILEPVTVAQLQNQKYLALLTSKRPSIEYDLKGIKTSMGEFRQDELDARINTFETNEEVAKEIMKRAKGRRHWLLFCTSIEHSKAMAEILDGMGIPTIHIDGNDPKPVREEKLAKFTSGEVTAMTNIGILTTGFDFPDIDCIVLLRPTMSPGLYYQMIGRGLRLKSNGGNCLVLDFGGNIMRHGGVTCIKPPAKKGEGSGIAPMKVCPQCDEFVAAQTTVCPVCGFIFPQREAKTKWELSDEDIQGNGSRVEDIGAWRWQLEVSKKGNRMLTVLYFPFNRNKGSIKEFYPLFSSNSYGMRKAFDKFLPLLTKVGIVWQPIYEEYPEYLVGMLNRVTHPLAVKYGMDGKYTRVSSWAFSMEERRELWEG